MSGLPARRKAGAVLLAATAAAGFWAGWAFGLLPASQPNAFFGAGLIAACLLLLIDSAKLDFQGLVGTLLGLCPTAALLVLLGQAEDLQQVAASLGLWPLSLSLLGSLLALSLMPGTETRAAIARSGFILSLVLTVALLLGFEGFADRWVLQSPVHLLIAFCACLVLGAQARIAILGPPLPEETRLIAGMTQLLPLLGFAGTVWGIMLALTALPGIFATEVPSSDALQDLLGGLGTAFETTLLGLAAAVVVSVVDMLLPAPDSPK